MDVVALLRGIGPGNPRMRNAELVRVLQGVGLDDVRSVISSGNLLFRSEERSRIRLEDRIEAALLDHLGAPCTTIVRSRRQIDELLRLDPFDGHDDEPDARCNVTFLKHRPPAGVELPAAGDGYEILALEGQAVFSLVDTTRPTTPPFMAALERAFGREITTRTWRTVHRIARGFAR